MIGGVQVLGIPLGLFALFVIIVKFGAELKRDGKAWW